MDATPDARAPAPQRSESDIPDHGRAEAEPKPAPPRPAQSNSRAQAAVEEKREAETRRKRRPVVIVIAIIVGLLLVAGGVFYYFSGLGVESTDDAFVDGRSIAIAPQVTGQVVSLDVSDNEFVKKGAAIIHIDPRQFVIARDQAKANIDAAQAQAHAAQIAVALAKTNYPAQLQQAQASLATAQANFVNAQRNYARQARLSTLGNLATSQQQVDAALSTFRQAQGQVDQAKAQIAQADVVQQRVQTAQAQYEQQQALVEQAQAQLDQANLNLSHTVVTAPQDGWITNRNVNMGDYVTAGQQILSIVSPQRWVTANFKETQLAQMRPGDKADIKVDAYPNLTLHGTVQSIQRGTGSVFSAFPPENATGNFVKVVQRVPVKITIDSGLNPDVPLGLGLSVTPTVTVK